MTRIRLFGPAVSMLLMPTSLWAEAPQALPDSTEVSVPDINTLLGADDLKSADKYFIFHRPGVSFATAFADLSECDAMARNLLPGTGNSSIGGAAISIGIGAIVAGNQRHVRRDNMRRCMFFKGYGRYGLPKAIWQQISFDESGSGISDDARRPFLLKQAKIASGPQLQGKELGE